MVWGTIRTPCQNKTRKAMIDYEKFFERIKERYALCVEDYC